MAVAFGFFNSVDGDRTYNADQMSQYFEGLVSNGVYATVGGGLQVIATTGMTVAVQTGRAIIDCKWLKNDALATIDISAAHVALPRYSAVVVRLDYDARTISLTSKDGTAASTPTKPAMTNTGTVKELCLAYIYVAAGATTITQANITDMRASSSCGWVTGLVQQVDTSDLFLQWQTAYEDFWTTLESWKTAQENAMTAWKAAQENAMTTWQGQMQAAYNEWFSTLTDQLTVKTYIVSYSKTVTLAGSSTTISLDMTNYIYDESDIIEVHINGLLARPGTDYTLDTSGATPTVSPVATANGTVVTINVYQSKIGFYVLETNAGDLVVTDDNANISV